ncbi:BUD32 family EKC/KEOPS complex subunit [Comamonas composti]|uniref:hypothetical protein n=1 Tax=Comamonas composti TaxID=408558 RepID=UPI000479624C|nr:hypothetical protein [Comamonas composti]
MPTDPAPSPAAAAAGSKDYNAFLHEQLTRQQHNIQRYDFGDEVLWIKRASAGNPAWRYRCLDGLARLLRAPMLKPVPNPGGRQALATEVRRLRQLASHGLRVPQVLAACEDGFVMRHLGAPGAETESLGNAIEAAIPRGAQATLALWRQGLEALTRVHASGDCLSQAFARNMVCCADGEIGFIDFEDDPAAHLPLELCQLRDVLCYAHSTALFLEQSTAMQPARAIWQEHVAHMQPRTRQLLERTLENMAWVRHLPTSRRLGRDLQRVRMAYVLLTP